MLVTVAMTTDRELGLGEYHVFIRYNSAELVSRFPRRMSEAATWRVHLAESKLARSLQTLSIIAVGLVHIDISELIKHVSVHTGKY